MRAYRQRQKDKGITSATELTARQQKKRILATQENGTKIKTIKPEHAQRK